MVIETGREKRETTGEERDCILPGKPRKGSSSKLGFFQEDIFVVPKI